jgi:peptidyl-prolyl cis-trans isomerase SurA
LKPKATPNDTILAYQKIMEAREKILKGLDFEDVARQYSEDPSAKINGGNLGYFSAFAMVYPFENAAYNTAVNGLSMPFRTQFGYHIVKVNNFRESQGEVEVAHIMIKENKADSLYAKTKIFEIYSKLLQKENFELLAKLQSDDKNSAPLGGKLAKFNASRMISPFADVAFSLKKVNDISKPFKTPYGWHIVKLIKKYPVKAFSDLKEELTQKIEKSKRYKIAGTSVVKRLIKEYNISINNEILNLFLKNDTTLISENLDQMIFTINKSKTLLRNLITFSKASPNKSLKGLYQEFFENKILAYYKDNLEKTDADFAFTLQEYRDGLLLFNLLQDKIWQRSEKDTVGLKKFFNENRDKYFWNKRGDLIIASCSDRDKAVLVKKYLEENKTIDEIKKLINDGATIHVLFTNGILEENHKRLPKSFVLSHDGVSEVFDELNNFVVVKVNKIIESTPMLLKETRGRVINDYQEELDKNWIKELRQKYPVRINKKVLKKIIHQQKN